MTTYDKPAPAAIAIHDITVPPKRMRALRPATVEEIAESIAKVDGLIQPIVLRRDGDRLILNAGAHRLAAAEKLGWETIPAIVLDGIDADQALLIEIDENLVRADLSAAERAMHLAERKRIYETLYPDTKLGATGKARAKVRQNGEPYSRFTADAARKTGKSERTVQREIERATKIPDIAGVVGTVLDAPEELDALAKLPQPQQADLIAQAKEGKRRVTAIPMARSFKANEEHSGGEAAPKRGTTTTLVNLLTHRGQLVPYGRAPTKPVFTKQTNVQIGWAGQSWNPIEGCLRNCEFGCYAQGNADNPRFKRIFPAGFTPVLAPWRLDAPKNTPFPSADELKKDPGLGMVFVGSQGDLFGNWVPPEWLDQVFASCTASPQWTYLFLTKYPGRYVGLKFPPSAWVGTSVHEQKLVRGAEEAFRQIKGVQVKWLSLEPLMEPLQFTDLSLFDWVVIGACSATTQKDGYHKGFAPPFEWVARIVAQAREAGCAVWLKENLLGKTYPQAPGMLLPQELPIIREAARPEAPARAQPVLQAAAPPTRAVSDDLSIPSFLRPAEADQRDDAQGRPEQGRLLWGGDDEAGYLGRGLVEGGGPIAYTVAPVNFHGCEHFQASVITDRDPDLALPVRQLADRHGMSLTTHDVKGRRRALNPLPTADEAKAQCEADYLQQ